MYATALIDEERCIGCTKCIEACPTDAIVGAMNLMHTVIRAECIGCRLCLPPCPVDCIDMKFLAEKPFDDAVARQRVKARKARQARERREKMKNYERKKALLRTQEHSHGSSETPIGFYDPVAAALARARAKSQGKS
ncbi:MAG TPA: RnfABCDGE type electron transport complex subunit B [Stenotrophobium sp.]|jgi:electron transport complex protein RnfB|nr:RnfABCDGE type electron transport complex subunit B [Stenotrophobium sp.]